MFCFNEKLFITLAKIKRFVNLAKILLNNLAFLFCKKIIRKFITIDMLYPR